MIVLSLPIMIVATCLSVQLAYCVHLNTVYTLLFSKVKQKRDYFCLIAKSQRAMRRGYRNSIWRSRCDQDFDTVSTRLQAQL